MKRERILKTIIVLIIGVVLFAMTSNVFAADTGLDFFDDTTNQLDTNTNTNNYNTNLPKAGAGENTIMGVAITVLAVVAIFAYKKVNQYKNI